jgi:D-aminopeptidase
LPAADTRPIQLSEAGTQSRPHKLTKKKRKNSIIVVIATNAPLLPNQLKRLARRATHGIARTGTITNDDSGEIFIAFSTANPTDWYADEELSLKSIPNDNMDPLFEAVVQATEEAIINTMVAADDMKARGNYAQGITNATSPTLLEVMKQFNRLGPPKCR